MVTSIQVLPTTPALVIGRVSHSRREKLTRKFTHKTYQWLVDLDNLPNYPWYLRSFTSFSPKDHLGDPNLSIKENVEHFLALNHFKHDPFSQIFMLANARILGYTFDPLTVFWCIDKEKHVQCVLAEVRNTFGQRHLYLLQTDSFGKAQTQKEFHVSPFLDTSGEYEMEFTISPEIVSTTVLLRRQGNLVFIANFHGRPIPATRSTIIAQLVSKPFMTQRITMLIRIHGIWLWLRRLPVFKLPHHDLQEGV